MRVDTKEVVRRQLRALGNDQFRARHPTPGHRRDGASDAVGGDHRRLGRVSEVEEPVGAFHSNPSEVAASLRVRRRSQYRRRVRARSSGLCTFGGGRELARELSGLAQSRKTGRSRRDDPNCTASRFDPRRGPRGRQLAAGRGARRVHELQTERHQRPDGLYPFARLHMARHHVFPRAKSLVRDAKRVHAAEQAARERARATYAGRDRGSVQDIAVFHERAKYEGDLHRADFAWAIHALSRGWSEQRVEETILHARDLRHKGSRREQEKYAHRTMRMAIRRGLGRTIDLLEDTLARRGGLGR